MIEPHIQKQLLNLIAEYGRLKALAIKNRRDCNEFKKLCGQADEIYFRLEKLIKG